jgi:hypothetical protein
MLENTSYLDDAQSQGELVNKILHQEIPCSLLRVIFPKYDNGEIPYGFVYLDF